MANPDPAASMLVPPAVLHPASGRALPEFPKDDYDYTYLTDYMALPEVPKSCRAVIFGCGRGEASVYLSERGFRVTGLDSDRTAIGLARERAWLNNRDVDFMIGDVFEISALLPAESFGLAIDRSVFRQVEGERERRRYLESIGRLLLPGGILMLSATEVDLPKKSPKYRKSSRQDTLLVQEGGPVVGEVIRAGLFIVGRHLYPISNTRAELLLYCRK
ncbi:MAG: class I SAM-dependent methyltransferase [Planctomycetota bacterium]